MGEDGGDTCALGLVEQLRDQCGALQRELSEAYHRMDALIRQLSNPNLHDLPINLPYHIEMWTADEQHIRWVIGCASTVSVALARSRRQSKITRPNDGRFARASTSFAVIPDRALCGARGLV
jgi:hypothetical protein